MFYTYIFFLKAETDSTSEHLEIWSKELLNTTKNTRGLPDTLKTGNLYIQKNFKLLLKLENENCKSKVKNPESTLNGWSIKKR